LYFHVGYGGARRRYGGAGRNSPPNNISNKLGLYGFILQRRQRKILPAPYQF